MKLRQKYSLIIILLTFIICGVLAGFLLVEFKSATNSIVRQSAMELNDKLTAQLKNRGRLMAGILAESLPNALYYTDLPVIDEIIATAVKQKDVLHILVFDEGGKVVRQTPSDRFSYSDPALDRKTMTKLYANEFVVVKDTGDTVEMLMPVWIGDIPVGGIQLGLSKQGIEKEVATLTSSLAQIQTTSMNNSLRLLLYITGVILFFGMVMSYLIIKRLLKPLEDVIQYANEIGNGNYDFSISKGFGDEIGELIRAFDQMKGNIRNKTVRLGDLEKIIELRTTELAGLNRDLKEEVEQRKKVEKDLKEYRDHLELLVGKRTAELKASNVQLKREIEDRIEAEFSRREAEIKLKQAEKMEAVGRLASGVAHDLNNILSGIASYPELILMDLPKNDPLRTKIETIRNSGQKAAAIVKDLLTLGRRGVTVSDIVDIEHIVSEYLNSPEHEKLMVLHPGIRIKTLFKTKPYTVQGSAIHLTKTVMNLVLNAVESIPEQGTIEIMVENRDIQDPISGFTGFKAGRYVVLTISDTGRGIPPEDIDRIFEPFFTNKSMGHSGSGLGMTVVWGTVKDLDGHIDVSSQMGRGTTFTLYFPATEKAAVLKTQQDWMHQYQGNGESVLIVDDAEEQREILSGILRRLKYNVMVMPNGESAVDYLKQQAVDMVVLDMIMEPGMDGLETYKQILQIYPHQKAIIASGYSESGRVKQAQKLGAGAYVQKPYKIMEVAEAIKKELYDLPLLPDDLNFNNNS